jgi:hypothetical protein
MKHICRAKTLNEGIYIEGYYGKCIDINNPHDYKHFLMIPTYNAQTNSSYFTDKEIDYKTLTIVR